MPDIAVRRFAERLLNLKNRKSSIHVQFASGLWLSGEIVEVHEDFFVLSVPASYVGKEKCNKEIPFGAICWISAPKTANDSKEPS